MGGLLTDVDAALSANRRATDDFLAACERCSPVWTAPRAPGKWSPSQLVEHVARAYEESANAVVGAPTKFPKIPGWLRPILRTVFFNRVGRKGTFFKGRTNKALDPAEGPATPAVADYIKFQEMHTRHHRNQLAES